MAKYRRETMRKNAGVALLTALAMLVVVSLLGGAYVKYMSLEKEAAELDLRQARARTAAEAGVQASIAALGRAFADGQAVPGQLTLTVPYYRAAGEAEPALDDGRSAAVTVTVTDEAGRINLNYAPTQVLSAILGINLNEAREIRTRLPRLDSDDPSSITKENARFLASVDELQTRGLVKPEALERVNKELLTVHSGSPDSTAGWLNVNSAPPEVLAAVLGIAPEAAVEVRRKAPFSDLGQLAAASGKDPSTFNVRPSADSPGALPQEVAFESRCFRIVSHALLTENGREVAGSTVETVVYVGPDGRAEVRYWNEAPGIEQPQEGPANAA